MQQYNLADIRAFIKVVETGSFNQAAEQLHASTAAVSRRVTALENALGSKLLYRTTRQLSLTEAGEQYYHDIQNALGALDEAGEKLQQGKQVINGSLRVAVPLSFGIERIAPILPEFLKKYPDLKITLEVDDRETDLYAEGIDVAVRIGQLKDSSMIATRIGHIETLFCASPEYLAEHGEPRCPADLNGHKILHYSLLNANEEWGVNDLEEHDKVSLEWQLSANNGEILREAAIRGLGVAMMPTFIVDKALENGSLIPVMQDYTKDKIDIYALRPSRQFTPAKIKCFIEFLKQNLG